MADKHAPSTHAPSHSAGHGGHHDHDHHPVEEEVLRTPMWLPVVGLGLLLFGAMGSYLWVYPGTMRSSDTVTDGGTADAAEAPVPTPPLGEAH